VDLSASGRSYGSAVPARAAPDDALAQIAFDLALAFDDGADTTKIVLSQFAHVGIGADVRFLQDGS
jgi:hypothetical protein